MHHTALSPQQSSIGPTCKVSFPAAQVAKHQRPVPLEQGDLGSVRVVAVKILIPSIGTLVKIPEELGIQGH